MFLLETLVELLGDLLDVKGRAYPARDIDDGRVIFLVQREGKLLKLLYQRLARLAPMIDMLTRPVRLAWLTLHPLPIQRVPVMGGVHDEVFPHGFGNGLFDLLAGGVIGKCFRRILDVLVGNEAPLMGDGFEGKRPVADGDFRVAATVVPAKFFDEQEAKVEVLQIFSDLVSVEGRRHFSYCSTQSSPWSK